MRSRRGCRRSDTYTLIIAHGNVSKFNTPCQGLGLQQSMPQRTQQEKQHMGTPIRTGHATMNDGDDVVHATTHAHIKHTHIRTNHAHLHMYSRTPSHVATHAYTYARQHIHPHTHTYTHIHTHTHTNANTPTHTHPKRQMYVPGGPGQSASPLSAVHAWYSPRSGLFSVVFASLNTVTSLEKHWL